MTTEEIKKQHEALLPHYYRVNRSTATSKVLPTFEGKANEHTAVTVKAVIEELEILSKVCFIHSPKISFSIKERIEELKEELKELEE